MPPAPAPALPMQMSVYSAEFEQLFISRLITQRFLPEPAAIDIMPSSHAKSIDD
jgi:hypothetical protein